MITFNSLCNLCLSCLLEEGQQRLFIAQESCMVHFTGVLITDRALALHELPAAVHFLNKPSLHGCIVPWPCNGGSLLAFLQQLESTCNLHMHQRFCLNA